MSDNAFQQINRDTENAKRGIAPDILTSVYGDRPPKAAEFGKGVSDIAGVKQATDARREIKPGSYDHKR